MLCSSQSQNYWGSTFCKQQLAERYLPTREQAGIISWSALGRQCLHGTQAQRLADRWPASLGLPVTLKGTRRSTPQSRPSKCGCPTRNLSTTRFFSLQLGKEVLTIPVSCLLLLCEAWTTTEHSGDTSAPRGCSSGSIGAGTSHVSSTASRAQAFKVSVVGLFYKPTC